MEYAYNLALNYYKDKNELPINTTKIVKTNSYIWADDNYEKWNKYSIFVYKEELLYNCNIINITSFSA
jgi:hypothetical protein